MSSQATSKLKPVSCTLLPIASTPLYSLRLCVTPVPFAPLPPPALTWPLLLVCWVWVGQLHEVDHLGPNPQPGAPVGQLVVGAVGVHLKA